MDDQISENTIYITDCSSFTRDFLQAIGKEVGL